MHLFKYPLFAILCSLSMEVVAQSTERLHLQMPATDSSGFKQSIHVSYFGDTLYTGNTYMILPGISAENYIIDADTNFYTSVAIGDQEWMLENLRTTKYNDGSPIPIADASGLWSNRTSHALCWYDGNKAFQNSMGALYNWYAINQSLARNKNVCPIGWHIPNTYEWELLFEALSDTSKIKGFVSDRGRYGEADIATLRFKDSLGGRRVGFDGAYTELYQLGYWWVSTEVDNSLAYGVSYGPYDGMTMDKATDKRNGYSVRCVRDYR